MTLPKNARTIEVAGRIYRWMVGKPSQFLDKTVANLVIEDPEGTTYTFREVLRHRDEDDEELAYTVSVTPGKVRERILKAIIGRGGEGPP